MTGGPSRDLERLDRFLSRVDRRHRLAPILRGAAVGAALGLVALVARALASALGLLPDPAGLLLLLLAWVLPAAGAVAGYRRPDLAGAAALGDRRAHLQDLLKSVHGFAGTSRDQEAWRPLLERRAAERVAGIQAAAVAPTPWRPIAALTALLLACLLAPQPPGTLIPVGGGLARVDSEPSSTAAEGQATAEPPQAAPEEAQEPPTGEQAVLPRLELSAEQLARLRDAEVAGEDAEVAGESGESAGEVEGGDEAALSSALGDQAASEASPASEELLREVRRQLEEEGTLPSAGEPGAAGQNPAAAEDAAAASRAPTAPTDPRLQQQSDELTTMEAATSAPSSQLSRRSAGVAEVAVPAGIEIEAGERPRQGAQSGDPGAADGGGSTAPQEGFVDPLGEVATELEVTLELALLQSQQEEAARETTREMTPSRAGESTLSTRNARQPVAPAAESVPVRSPVPWRHRQLVREYFDPSEPAHSLARPAPQETPPS